MVALTNALARTQLSKDIFDHFASTTTAGGGTTTTVDNLVANFDDDTFVSKYDTFIYAVAGTDAGLWRRVTSKAGITMTHVAFPNGVGNGIAYEIHRIANPDEKDVAIASALNLMNGVILFKKSFSDLTMVANQFDYGVPSGFWRDQPRQIHLVSSGDDEVTQELFNWTLRTASDGTPDIHFYDRMNADDKVRVWGHQVVAVTDLVDGEPEALLLSARAAILLYTQVISQAPQEQVSRYVSLLSVAQTTYTALLASFRPLGIPLTQLMPGMHVGRIGMDFGV